MNREPGCGVVPQPAERRAVVLSLVERGWRAARECSLDLEGRGPMVIHLVNGWLSRPVRDMISPKPHIRLLSVWRGCFWPAVGAVSLGLLVSGRLRGILVDRERSARRVRRWVAALGIAVLIVREGTQGYELWRDGQPLGRGDWFRLLGVHDACADLR